jgi:hypothetical protein
VSEFPRNALYSWMRPAWWIGRLRPGLRAATAADAARLRELPSVLGRIVLPALAIGVPLLLCIGHATTHRGFWSPEGATGTALIIYDVFTESIPFMIVAGAIGLASPAAGVLVALTYAVGNLAVTAWSDELIPVLGAFVGRLVTYLVLWLLVVEIPLLGRLVFEWWSNRDDAPRAKRIAALLVSALVVAVLTGIWVLGAPLLVVVVFFKTSVWMQAPYVPAGVMVIYGKWVAVSLGLATLVIFGVRYCGPIARVGREEDEPAPGAPLVAYLGGLALTVLVLASVLRKPVDAIVLLAGLLAARPVARRVLSVTGLARPLAVVAWPLRLILGFAFSLGFAWLFLASVGVSSLSGFFNMVIAIAVGFIIMEIFLAADEVAVPRRPPTGVATALGIAVLLFVGIPATALADNYGDQADMPGPAAAAAAAAGAAGAAAFLRRLPKRKLPEYSGPPGQESGGPGHGGGPPKLKEYRPPGAPPPNPPPWWMPDGFGGFFGYD